MLKHYSSVTRGDFRRNWKVLYRIIEVCHKDVCHEKAQVKAQWETRRYYWNNSVWYPWDKGKGSAVSKIQTGLKAGARFYLSFPLALEIFLNKGYCLSAKRGQNRLRSCSPPLCLQMLIESLIKSFLFHSFAVWGWGEFKSESHSDLYWTAVAAALNKKKQTKTKANQLTITAQTPKASQKHKRGFADKFFQDCIACMWKNEEKQEFIF